MDRRDQSATAISPAPRSRRRWRRRRRRCRRRTSGHARATRRWRRRAPSPTCAATARHDLDVVAGHLRPARHTVARVRPRAREGAGRLPRGVGIVRHQRRRPRGGRRGAAVEDHRQAGARAVDAPGRAWLGSEGPAAAARLRGGLDAAGRIVAWETQMWIPANRRGARILLAAEAAGLPQDSGRDAAAITRTAIRPMPSTTCACSRTGCATRR